MSPIEITDTRRFIPKSLFEICKIDGLTLTEISKMYNNEDIGKKSGAFQLDKFVHHLETKHGMTLQSYCEQYLGIHWPRCAFKGTVLGYRFNRDGLNVSRYAKGVGITKEMSPAFAAACERFARERVGKGNPMYGKTAWNTGLGIEDERVRRIAEAQRGKKASEETRALQRLRRAQHPLKARHTQKHSPETVEKLKAHTANLWATGVFKRVTSIHIKVREFLKTLDLFYPFVEEHQVRYFSMDMAFPAVKVAIECQGTYYHVDPRIYPNGPKDAIQRRNYGRDKTKRKICEREGWKIIELWETEINDGSFKEQLLCKLKEYGVLNQSV